jgi:glycosyltransferase involved in cell wall biosynthesis
MRLGFLLYGDLSTRTGGFLYDRMLIQGLQELGVQVQVIQLPWRSYTLALLSMLLNRDLAQLSLDDFDVLIEDELAHPSLIRANRYISEHTGTPVVSLVHHLRCSEDHPAPLNLLYRWIEAKYLNTIDGVIANSPATLQSIESLLKRRLPSVVAPPGRGHFDEQITAEQISSRCTQPGPLEILFLGSIVPRKRLDDLIEALASIPEIELRLTVIGRDTTDDQHTHKIRKLIDARGLEANVRWLGEQPDAGLQQVLETAHLLVVPSSHEGFGIAYLDAMAFGVLPIGTRSGGASSLIDHTETGFLIEPGNIEQLAGYIALLAKDRKLLHRMAEAAFRRYQQQPTWEEVTAIVYDYLKVYILGEDQSYQ